MFKLNKRVSSITFEPNMAPMVVLTFEPSIWNLQYQILIKLNLYIINHYLKTSAVGSNWFEHLDYVGLDGNI